MHNTLEHSYLVVREAIGSDAKEIADGLRLFGKKASPAWVYAQGYQPGVNIANFHENYKRWLGAFAIKNKTAGLNILRNDLTAWLHDLVKPKHSLAILEGKTLRDLILVRQTIDDLIAA